MKWIKKIVTVGNSACVVIPSELLEYMKMKVGDVVEMQDDDGKNGKFVSFWKKPVETTNKEKSNENRA